MTQFVGFLAGFRDAASVLADHGWRPRRRDDDLGHVRAVDPVDLCRRAVRRALRANRQLSGALAAITAAVVGVILNLAVWFALHVLFRKVTEMHLGPLRWYAFDPLALDLRLRGAAIAAVLAFGPHRSLIEVGGIMAAAGDRRATVFGGLGLRSIALSCQRRKARCDIDESAKKITTPANDSSSSAANMRGILSR